MPELRRNAGLTTPLLAGLFHTKLYLPATGYSAEERKLIFYHELTHYCHRDLWYKMLLRVCASIYLSLIHIFSSCAISAYAVPVA